MTSQAVTDYVTQSIDLFNGIARAAARAEKREFGKAHYYCADPIPMDEAIPLPALHTIGSRPNTCFTCCRTRENAR